MANETNADTKAAEQGVRIEEVHMNERGVNAVFTANKEVLSAFVSIFVDLFEASGATNFVELECHNSKLGPLAITIKRKLGKTPEQVANEANAKLEAAETALSQARQEIAELKGKTKCG